MDGPQAALQPPLHHMEPHHEETEVPHENEEYNELLKLAAEMRNPEFGVLIENRTYHLKVYKRCFIGSEAVEWLISHGKAADRGAALELGQKMLDYHIFFHVCYAHPFRNGYYFYRFQEDESTKALNMKVIWTGKVRTAQEIAKDLRTNMLKLYGKYMSSDGTGVNYQALKSAPEFAEFVHAACELQRVDITSLSYEEKLAFFINIYNVLVIHGQVKFGPPNGMLARAHFFRKTSYNIGGHEFSLDDIEHGILRGNKRRQFRTKDPRCIFILTRVDPRIHFALVCGAKSCPPIKVYTPERIGEMLQLAAEGFCEQEVDIYLERREIVLSKIFQWYKLDFGKSDSDMLQTIATYLREEKKQALEQLLASHHAHGSPLNIKYRAYDWSQNSNH